MPSSLLFWDVDTQFDLMYPAGKLYVPGAETIISNLHVHTSTTTGSPQAKPLCV
jgi:nicotinamidase-related amidase